MPQLRIPEAGKRQVALRELPPPLARVFALLVMDPGTDFDALAAAALADVTPAEAARGLGQVADCHLITEHAAGRYHFHKLIRVFSGRYARKSIPVSERAAALRRLADYILRAATAADSLISPHRYRMPIEVLDRSTALPPLGDYGNACWLSAPSLATAQGTVGRLGRPALPAGRSLDQRGDVARDDVVGLGLPDGPHQAVARDLQRPGRQLAAQPGQRRPDLSSSELFAAAGPRSCRQRLHSIAIQRKSPLRPP
jgi:hypothetical protein